MPSARVVWLSAMRTENQATVDSLLDLSLLISNFLKKAKHGVVLLDGFEYLITNHGFNAFIRFLQFIRSRFEHSEAILIAPLLEEALEQKQTKLIEREMKLLDAE
jgi:archaellum biogenesis ATPase FlaH